MASVILWHDYTTLLALIDCEMIGVWHYYKISLFIFPQHFLGHPSLMEKPKQISPPDLIPFPILIAIIFNLYLINSICLCINTFAHLKISQYWTGLFVSYSRKNQLHKRSFNSIKLFKRIFLWSNFVELTFCQKKFFFFFGGGYFLNSQSYFWGWSSSVYPNHRILIENPWLAKPVRKMIWIFVYLETYFWWSTAPISNFIDL